MHLSRELCGFRCSFRCLRRIRFCILVVFRASHRSVEVPFRASPGCRTIAAADTCNRQRR